MKLVVERLIMPRLACVFSLSLKLALLFGLSSSIKGLKFGQTHSIRSGMIPKTRGGIATAGNFQQMDQLRKFKSSPSSSSSLRIQSVENTDVVDVSLSSTASISSKLLELFGTGGGQSHNGRKELHNEGAKRKFSDPQMWTHLFFVAAAIPSYVNHVFDLFTLLAIVTPLSLAYHYVYEKPGFLAQVEGVCAKLLFIYGAAQMFHAPSKALLLTEIFFLLGTFAIFVFTNIKPRLYDPWHCLLHIVPSLWCIVVGLNHKPLLF